MHAEPRLSVTVVWSEITREHVDRCSNETCGQVFSWNMWTGVLMKHVDRCFHDTPEYRVVCARYGEHNKRTFTCETTRTDLQKNLQLSEPPTRSIHSQTWSQLHASAAFRSSLLSRSLWATPITYPLISDIYPCDISTEPTVWTLPGRRETLIYSCLIQCITKARYTDE
jgi:hypothetical protein